MEGEPEPHPPAARQVPAAVATGRVAFFGACRFACPAFDQRSHRAGLAALHLKNGLGDGF